MKKHYRHENDCLNCGAELQGKFCHNCGQENLQIKESFGHMLNHAVSDYFHFDHQFFHTLKPLLFQPGKLTIEYLNGRRAQYLHPVKMYIFISLMFFLLIFKSNHEVVRVGGNDESPKSAIGKDFKKNLDSDSSLSAAQKKALEKAVSKYVPGTKISKQGAPITITDHGDNKDSTYAQYAAEQAKLPAAQRDGFFERFYNKTFFAYKKKYGESAQEMFKEDVMHSFPKMMFVLLPLFALILKVTFWRNHKFYVEYIIYAIHLHCFIFLSWAIILIIDFLVPLKWAADVNQWLTMILFFWAVYYIYRSLRLLYNRKRWVTIFKMFTMSVMYWCVFSLCAMGLIMIVAAQAG